MYIYNISTVKGHLDISYPLVNFYSSLLKMALTDLPIMNSMVIFHSYVSYVTNYQKLNVMNFHGYQMVSMAMA